MAEIIEETGDNTQYHNLDLEVIGDLWAKAIGENASIDSTGLAVVVARFALLVMQAMRERRPNAPPRSPFDLKIEIGGETWEDTLHRLDELARHVRDHGPECALVGGGGGTNHQITIEVNDKTAEQYRAELQTWFLARRERQRDGEEQS